MRILTFAVAASTAAQAAPFAHGDRKAGKALHDKTCISCHAGMFGGYGSGIWAHPDRKTRSAQQFAARISGCNSDAGAGWVSEDEAHAGAYLKQQYYKFR